MNRLPGWTPATILVRTVEHPDGESRDCLVHDGDCRTSGLCINQREGRWVVSHMRSGMFINPTFSRPAVAADFLLGLANLTDWPNRTARQLREDAALRGAVVLLRENPSFRDCVTVECGTIQVAALDA